MKKEILRMENVTLETSGVAFLNNLNFYILQGEIMGLLSLNSEGKKQFIKLLCQNLPIVYGRIYFNDILVNNYEHSDYSMNNVYVIEQKSRLIQDLTVSDNIFVLRRGFKKYFINKRVLDKQVQNFFRQIDVEIDSNELIINLPPLKRCIVELVKAVVAGASLIIVHDLSNFLSPVDLRKFQEVIFYYSNQGFTFLYVGNHHKELFHICSRVALFDNVRIRKIFHKDEMLEKNITPFIISFDMSDSKIRRPNENSILKFNHVYSEQLKDMTFSIRSGECVTILDMDNSALFELIHIMNKGKVFDAGNIVWDGITYKGQMFKNPLKNGVIVIEDNPVKNTLFSDLTYLENLSFLVDKKIHKSIVKKDITKSIIKEYEPLLGKEIHCKNIRTLSGKSLYNLVYYRIYLYHPKVVFCVQPFSFADMYLRRHILDLIQMLKNKGITVIILAMSISDSLDVADRLLVIEQGHISREYTEKEFYLFSSKM